MNFPILSSITFLPLIGAFFVFLTRNEKMKAIVAQFTYPFLQVL